MGKVRASKVLHVSQQQTDALLGQREPCSTQEQGGGGESSGEGRGGFPQEAESGDLSRLRF